MQVIDECMHEFNAIMIVILMSERHAFLPTEIHEIVMRFLSFWMAFSLSKNGKVLLRRRIWRRVLNKTIYNPVV